MTPPAEALPPDQPPDEESLHRALGLTDDEFEAVGKILGRAAQPPRAGPLRRDVERALLVQVVPAAPAPPADRGPAGAGRPGRERRGDRRRRRHRRGHPHREPQPPLGHRALPGRGHRGGRHPARHLHHGRAPARRHGPALLRAARRRPPALAGRGRGERHLGLRQLGRGADRRRRAHLRPLLRPEPARQRAVHGRAARSSASCSASRRARATWPCCSARRTGRDGIGGVSVLASAGFSGDDAGAADDTKRPSVQVGDPFEEKRLIEACLELLDTKLVVGIQDLGGAGLACATSETAGRGGVGMDVDVVRRAPARGGHGALGGDDEREPGAHAGHRHARVVARRWPAICAKWEVRATVVGTVTEPEPDGGGRLRIRDGMRRPGAGRRAGRVALRRRAALRPPAPGAGDRRAAADAARRRPTDCAGDLLALLRSPALGLPPVRPPAVPEHRGRARAPTPRCCAWPGPGCRRRSAAWPLTHRLQPAGLRARPAGRAPRSSWPRAWPTWPASGPTPVAVVNCLNFGNPEHPEVMWQLSECIDGMAEACRALDLPGDRRQRQPLQRERRVPTSTRRRCSGVLGLVDAVHAPPARAGLVGRRHRRARSGARAAADGSFPLEGTRWATERRDHRTGRRPAVDFARARARRAPSWPGWWPRRWPAPTRRRRWCTPCTTSRAAAWPSRWPRWRPRPALGCTARASTDAGRALHRAAVALRGGDGRARRAVRPGGGRRDPGRRARPGRRRPASSSGDLVDLPVDALRDGARGEPGPGPGRTVMTRGPVREWVTREGSVRCLRGLRARR